MFFANPVVTLNFIKIISACVGLDCFINSANWDHLSDHAFQHSGKDHLSDHVFCFGYFGVCLKCLQGAATTVKCEWSKTYSPSYIP